MPEDHHDEDQTQSFVALTKGTEVGHYKIISKIGAGGMGEVYLAEDTALNRKVALKFMPVHLAGNADIRERFTREAQAAAKLDHPNIVPVFEVGEYQGRPYFAMAHIEGKSLREVIKEGKLSTGETISLTMQICAGLQDAHDAGIIHRDIKPGNIIIDNKGRPRLVDFGLAMVSGEDKLTKTGSTLGTVGYMSPEQVEGKKCDHRSDLFSVGVILYEMLAGRRPFEGDNDAAIIRGITDSTPEPIARYKSGVTDELQRIVSRALAKDPSARYQSAEELHSDLSHRTNIAPQKSKNRIILWVASAVIVLTAGYFGFTMLPTGTPTEKASEHIVLAVLPFENLGPPEDEYFAEGMTEEITTRLAGISSLDVLSRNSATRILSSGESFRETSSELGLSHVLRGTVRWDKNAEPPRVRISTQLIEVEGDRTVWADNYEQTLVDLFAVQADIAEKIVTQMGATLTSSDASMLAGIPTRSTHAYEHYLQALSSMRSVRRWEKPWFYRRETDSAVYYDSSFALAWALRSEAYSLNFRFNTDSSGWARVALESAERALALEPNMKQGFMALGSYYYQVKGDYEKALENYRLASSEVSTDALLCAKIATVLEEMGQFEDAATYLGKGIAVDPLNPVLYRDLAHVQRRLGSFEKALTSIDRAIAIEPDREIYYTEKTRILAYQNGDFDRLRTFAGEALDNMKSPEDSLDYIQFNWWLTYFIPNLGWDSLVIRNLQNDKRGVFLSNPDALFWNSGEVDIIRHYIDTVRIHLESRYRRDPDNCGPMLANFLSQVGECERALELVNETKARWLEEGEDPWNWTMARVYVECGQYDKALTEIENLIANRPWDTANRMRYTHWLDPLRDEPRYKALIEKIMRERGS